MAGIVCHPPVGVCIIVPTKCEYVVEVKHQCCVQKSTRNRAWDLGYNLLAVGHSSSPAKSVPAGAACLARKAVFNARFTDTKRTVQPAVNRITNSMHPVIELLNHGERVVAPPAPSTADHTIAE